MNRKRIGRWGKCLALTLTMGMLVSGTVFAATSSSSKDNLNSTFGPGTTSTDIKSAAPTEIYNKELGMYEEEFGSGRRIVSSVSNGGQVADAVYLSVPKGASVSLELDGVKHSFTNGGLLYDPGYYVMVVTDTIVGSSQKASTVMRFRILPPPSGRQNTGEYPYPKIVCGLEKTEVKYNEMVQYIFPNKKAFFSSLAQSGDTVTDAAFYFPPNVGYQLTRDGVGVALYNNEKIYDPGHYRLKAYTDSQAREGDYTAYYESYMDFTIPSNTIASAEVPVQAASGTGTENALTYQSDMLGESFREEAGLYEEKFSNGMLFYSNVADGAIVSGSVYLDIPADITVKMKRNGEEAPFVSRVNLSEEGTYILTLTSNTNLGGDKTIYQAFFRFRIQNSAPAVENITIPAEAESLATESGTLPEETVATVEETVVSDVEKAPEEDKLITTKDTVAFPDGEDYDETSKLFRYRFSDGTYFGMSIPNNGISNTPVELNMPAGGSGLIDYGGKQVAFKESVSAAEDGIYHLEVTGADGSVLVRDFRVMTKAVNDIQEVQAPDGYYISSVVENENPVKSASDQIYAVGEDGLYTFSFLSEYDNCPELFLALSKDTKAPELMFTGVDENGKAAGGEVTFEASEEGVTVTAQKGKKTTLVEGNTIKGGGKYVITATDAAGNQTSYSIQLQQKMNIMTLCAIIGLFVIALGFVIYYKAYGEKFRVR